MKTFIVAALLTLLAGCAATGTQPTGSAQPTGSIAGVTHQSLRQIITPGETTQADIIQLFGAPTEKGEDWAQFWRYDHRKSNSALGGAAFGGALEVVDTVFGILDTLSGAASAADPNAPKPTYTETSLLIRFNDDGTVDDYELDINPEAT